MIAAEIVADWKREFGFIAARLFGDALKTPDELSVAFGTDTVAVFRPGETEPAGVVAIGSEGASQKIRALASGARRREASLSLSSGLVLRADTRLPRASHRTLRRALGYEIEQLSPISPDEIYFDSAVAGRDAGANTVDLELRIIRRDVLDRAIALCHAAGIAVSEIRFEGDARPADWRVFPVARGALLRALTRRWGLALLGGVALVLAVAIFATVYLRDAAVADDLADQVSTEGTRAAQVERLRHRIDLATTQLVFLEKRKRAPLFVSVLNDVTRTLPDGTWITQFDLERNKVRIQGYSHAASDLIAAFDRSGRFANAQFAAPVTQGMAAGVERFDLTFELAEGKP